MLARLRVSELVSIAGVLPARITYPQTEWPRVLLCVQHQPRLVVGTPRPVELVGLADTVGRLSPVILVPRAPLALDPVVGAMSHKIARFGGQCVGAHLLGER